MKYKFLGIFAIGAMLATTATAQNTEATASLRILLFFICITPLNKIGMQRPSKTHWQRSAKGRKSPTFGRGFLASSHAGTRLPIAAFPIQGAPPQPGSERSGALCFLRSASSLRFIRSKRKSGSCRRSRKHHGSKEPHYASYGGIIHIRL